MKNRTIAPLLLAMSPAFAASTLMEEIVVTADYRGASVMDLPASVTVVDQDDAESRNAKHLEQVLALVPNVNYASGSSRARFFQIRGIGERSQFVDPVNPSVGLIIDEIDYSGIGTGATLFDVEQVEVLRGPQGTRFGANALAGLINLKTADPTTSPDVRVRLTAGDYGTLSTGIVVSGPLNDNLGIRLGHERSRSDGYIDNIHLGRDDTNRLDESTTRAKINYRPDAISSFALTLARVDAHNGYDAFSLDNNRTTRSDQPGSDDQETNAIAASAIWRRDQVDIHLITTWSSSAMEYSYDEDWTHAGFDPIGYTSFDQYLRDRDQASAEVRFISAAGRDIAWVAGAYLQKVEEALTRNYTFAAGPFNSDHDYSTAALFGQVEAALGDSSRLSAGLRVERREARYRNSESANFDPTDTMVGGQIALQRDFGEDSQVFVSVARGYKAGGFNSSGSLDDDLREFDPETLLELEAGVKGSRANLVYQLAAFYDWRRDQQAKSSLTRVRSDGSTEFIDFNTNAAKGTNRGVEVELSYRVSDTLSASAGFGLLDATFDKFINEFGENLSGRAQAHAPDYTFSAGLDYARDGWFFNLSADGKDQFFFADRHALRSRSHVLVNARVGYQSAHFKLSFWGRNLGDKNYFVRGFGSFGNDPRDGYVTPAAGYVQFGEPRVLGVTFETQLQ